MYCIKHTKFISQNDRKYMMWLHISIYIHGHISWQISFDLKLFEFDSWTSLHLLSHYYNTQTKIWHVYFGYVKFLNFTWQLYELVPRKMTIYPVKMINIRPLYLFYRYLNRHAVSKLKKCKLWGKKFNLTIHSLYKRIILTKFVLNVQLQPRMNNKDDFHNVVCIQS
jgi:hypothetical protein